MNQIDMPRVNEVVSSNFEAFYNTSNDEKLSKPSRALTLIASQISIDDISKAKKQFAEIRTLEIVDYLSFNHHYYLTKKLPEIQQSIMHVFKNEEVSDLLRTLAMFFAQYQKDLIAHIKMEEKVFFPLVRKLFGQNDFKKDKTEEWTAIMEFVGNHDPIEERLQLVGSLIRDAVSDQKIPFAYGVFMNQIELFELDLKRHAIIEDEILLPRVKEIL